MILFLDFRVREDPDLNMVFHLNLWNF